MKELYKDGQSVFIKFPQYSNRRRATIVKYDKQSQFYEAKMDKSRKIIQVSEDQISAIEEKKNSKVSRDQGVDYYSKAPFLESISTQQTPAMVRTRRILTNGHASKVFKIDAKENISTSKDFSDEVEFLSSNTIQKNDIITSQESSPIISNPNKDTPEAPILSYNSYVALQLFFYVIFGGFCMLFLNSCFEGRCSVFPPNYLSKIISFTKLFMNQYDLFGMIAILIFSHFTLYMVSTRFTVTNKSLDAVLPVIMSMLLYSVYRFSFLDFQLIFNRIHYIAGSYLLLAVTGFLVTSVLNKAKIYKPNTKVFIEQHSIVLLFLMFIFYISKMPSNTMENFSFYYLFLFCYIIICLSRINNVGRTNYFDLIFARPFLLTIPIHNSISLVPHRWSTYCYVPIFIVFMLGFVKQIESKFKTSSSFYYNFYNSMVKLCMASLAGFYSFSTPSWISVFAELFIEHIL